MQTAGDIENGLGWPNGGGWLDESKVLVDGVRIARKLHNDAANRKRRR